MHASCIAHGPIETAVPSRARLGIYAYGCFRYSDIASRKSGERRIVDGRIAAQCRPFQQCSGAIAAERGRRTTSRSLRGTPSPVPDLRQILAMLVDVMLVLDKLVAHRLFQTGALAPETRLSYRRHLAPVGSERCRF